MRRCVERLELPANAVVVAIEPFQQEGQVGPLHLRDRLYGEVDDSCALCGTRGAEQLTVHHIDGDHGNDVYENTIVLCHNCHTRYHQGKGVAELQVKDRKRHLMQNTMTTYGLNALKIADRNGFGVVAMPFLLYHMVDLGFMEQKEEVMRYGADRVNLVPERPGETVTQDDAMARFSITDRGRGILSAWFA